MIIFSYVVFFFLLFPFFSMEQFTLKFQFYNNNDVLILHGRAEWWRTHRYDSLLKHYTQWMTWWNDVLLFQRFWKFFSVTFKLFDLTIKIFEWQKYKHFLYFHSYYMWYIKIGKDRLRYSTLWRDVWIFRGHELLVFPIKTLMTFM